jgi:hypothetical protein
LLKKEKKFKSKEEPGATPVTIATQETEIRRISV